MMLLHSLAFALTPTQGAGLLDVGAGTMESLAITSDGEAILGIDRSNGQVHAVIVDSWATLLVADDCGATAVASGPSPDGGATEFIFVGCDTGEVYGYELVDETIVPLRAIADDETSAQVVFQLTDGDGEDLEGIDAMVAAYDGTDDYVYVFQGGSSTGWVNTIVVNRDAQFGDAAVEGFPIATLSSSFAGAALQGDYVHFVHDGQRSTNVSIPTRSVTPASSAISLYGPDDVHYGLTQLWMCDTDNGIVYGHNAITATNSTVYTGMGAPEQVAVSITAGAEWMALGGETLDVYGMTNGLLTDATSPDLSLALDGVSIGDILVDYQDRGIVGRSDGTFQVLSASPWIDDVVVSPADAEPGDTVELSFSVSEEASWDVYFGGDRFRSGTSLGSGTVGDGGGSATLTIEVTEDWSEGTNLLYILADNGNQIDGHARASVVVDTPPEPPVLTEANLGFGEGSLVLSFDGIEDEDLAHYLVYVSDTAFEAADHPTGGPEGPDGWDEHPLTLESTAGASVSVTLSPLENNVTYHVAVRAVDSGGLESTMSNVISGTPQEVMSALELAGETGGSSCATGPGTGAYGLLVGLGALVLRSRRWAIGGLLLGGTAVAGEGPKGDMTAQRGNVELRYGPMFGIEDDALTTVYGETGHEMLQLEFGPQLTRFFEVDLGVGFYQELATAVSADGEASSVRTMLTTFPLNLSGTARLHIIDEQLIVPYARLGMDYVYYSELTDNDSGGKDRVSGAKVGHHYGFGANLLLDIFAPGRASLLEAQTGINDTYITFEYRRQNIDSRKTPWAAANGDGLDLSANMFTIGLKLDY